MQPVHLDFVEPQYRSPRTEVPRANPFPLVGLTAAQLDALVAWNMELDERATPQTDAPRPHGDPLASEIAESERVGSEGSRNTPSPTDLGDRSDREVPTPRHEGRGDEPPADESGNG